MASPQLENGYTRIANEIVEALALRRIPGEQMQVLFHVLRMTYGYQRKSAEISMKSFVLATNLKRQNITRATKSLVSKNIIRRIKNDSKTDPTYRFNKDFTSWKTESKMIQGESKVIPTGIKNDSASYIKEKFKEKGKEPAPAKKTSQNKKFTPPTLQDVIKFFREKGYSDEAAKKAFEYYDVADWKDSKGKQVRNWKQKMIAVWFKDENKTKGAAPQFDPEEERRKLEEALS